MSSVILTNWTVYYASDVGAGGGYKQIRWTGGATGTNTVNELYSALMNLFDNTNQNDSDDSIPMKAVTPTLYEIGSFDAGDDQPWFIDPESVKHLTGGGLNSRNWARAGSGSGEAGIVKITRGAGTNNIVPNDIGATISNTGFTDTGWLLHIDETTDTLWIRPTSNSTDHDWNHSSGTITCNAHSDTQASYVGSGESIWANIYSIGSIVSNTDIYVSQSDTLLTQWWDTGHIDILVLVSDHGTLIDNGLLRVFARQYSTLYDNFEASVPTGGRNPIPLATSNDVNNNSGYGNITFTAAVDTYTLGEKITGGTSTAEGIVTSVTGSPTTSLQYYLIGTVTTDFQAAEVINGTSSGSNESSVAVTSTSGPKATTPAGITVTFGGVQKDLNNGYGDAWYSAVIDCNNSTIAQVYERLKYITRRGHTGDIDASTQTIPGEQYQGIGELYIPYDAATLNPPFTKGDIITGPSSFSGTLTAIHVNTATEGFLIIRDYSGTIPSDGNTLTSTNSVTVDENTGADPVATISPSKQAPFGTFAGGKFFGARGVWIETATLDAGDANNYQLIDSENNTQIPPASISISVGNLVSGDKVAVFRANTDGSINKTYLPSDTTANSAATTSWTVDSGTTIPTDTPSTGTIRLVDKSTGAEEKRTYSGWTGQVFTLTVAHSGGYTDANDSAYVPYIDVVASGSTASKSVIYDADRTVLARVRIIGIEPFSVTGTLDGDGYSVDAIRNTDGAI